MAEVQVVAEPETNPAGQIVSLLELGVVLFLGYEIIRHESQIFNIYSEIFGSLPSKTVDTSTNNQNPGTVSPGPGQYTPPSAVSGPSGPGSTKTGTISTPSGLVTISHVTYGIYGLLPIILHLEGRIFADGSVQAYACDRVTADVTLVNNTDTDYDVTLYGYVIPANSSPDPSNAVGHFWPGNAAGIVPGTPYQGIYPGKITAKSQVVTTNVSTAPMSVPNEKFGVLWQVYISGYSSPTSQVFQPLMIYDNFQNKPSCSYGS
jgi:hypothetical protein